MNPSNFKTVMPAVILLQLPLTDICIQEDNCTTLLYYPQNQTYIHTNKQTTTNTHTKKQPTTQKLIPALLFFPLPIFQCQDSVA